MKGSLTKHFKDVALNVIEAIVGKQNTIVGKPNTKVDEEEL